MQRHGLPAQVASSHVCDALFKIGFVFHISFTALSVDWANISERSKSRVGVVALQVQVTKYFSS